jgi:hypothetical protein
MSSNDYTYNPLDKNTFNAIAYNAMGRASEINTKANYSLKHSTGSSGWSVGVVQWDFGQHTEQVAPLLDNYQKWASEDKKFTPQELNSLSHKLTTSGQTGNALTAVEHSRLNAYLRSDEGRDFVNSLSQQQIDKEWKEVGQPLSQVKWLQDLSKKDPAQAAEIVTMTCKLYNQNTSHGHQLVEHLEKTELTSEQTKQWIGTEGIKKVGTRAKEAIISGRDNALIGIQLMNRLELGDSRLSQAWREEVHDKGNTGLTQGFNTNPDVQLLDAMMRDPAKGLYILDNIEGKKPVSLIIEADRHDTNAQLEMAKVKQGHDGSVTVSSPDGDKFEMIEQGWYLNDLPKDEQEKSQSGSLHGNSSPPQNHTEQKFSTGDPDLDRLAAAVFSGNEAAISQANARIEQSPQVQGMIQQGHDILAAQQREEQQQQEAMKQNQGPSLAR